VADSPGSLRLAREQSVGDPIGDDLVVAILVGRLPQIEVIAGSPAPDWQEPLAWEIPSSPAKKLSMSYVSPSGKTNTSVAGLSTWLLLLRTMITRSATQRFPAWTTTLFVWHRHGSASWDTLVEHPPALLQVLEVPGYRQQNVASLFVGAPRRGVPGVAPRLDHRHPHPGLLEPVERELR
jgi:hypothetical protein